MNPDKNSATVRLRRMRTERSLVVAITNDGHKALNKEKRIRTVPNLLRPQSFMRAGIEGGFEKKGGNSNRPHYFYGSLAKK